MNATEAKKANGHCVFERISYILTQQAYSVNDCSSEFGYNYQANAKKESEWDDEGADEYIVMWETIDECEDGDESNACDWDNPINVLEI